MIVALVGMPSSGKGEASKIFEELGFSVVRMRSAVLEKLGEMGLEVNIENVGKAALRMREERGPAAVAEKTLPAVKAAGENVCIEGVRSREEVEFFREAFGDFACVGIDAPAEKRYEWALGRDREDDARSPEEFGAKEKREGDWGIGKAVGHADYIVQNDGSLEEFRRKVRELVEKILKGREI